jgi:hypothetical protein
VAAKSKSKERQKAARRAKAAARKKAASAKSAADSSRTPVKARPANNDGGGAGSEVSVKDEIARADYNGPHVVILGAGASVAACPEGDVSGKRLPVMKDFLDVVDLGDLPDLGSRDDFEVVYSKLVSDPAHATRCKVIEQTIYDYFATMRLPPTPTIYDYLVLSLRPKDVIATFNWDPFLLQALRRCYREGERAPTVLFLHGNVLAGYCADHKRLGPTDARCSVCDQPFTPSRLLYPVVEKKYDEDPLIADAWRFLRKALERAFWVTVFGYSAPKSDVAARELLLGAWGGGDERALEQIELIDIRPEEDLLVTWGDFIHSHHYEVHSSFFDSWIANHPRRTGEAYWHQYVEAKWIHPNPVPQGGSLEDLVKWFAELRAAEKQS